MTTNTTTTADGYPDVTTRDLGTVTLAKTTYQVEELLFSSYTDKMTGKVRSPRSDVHLIGPKGGRYLLRPYLEKAGDSGLRQVISLGSGQPLRKGGNEVRVIRLGDVIEVAP